MTRILVSAFVTSIVAVTQAEYLPGTFTHQRILDELPDSVTVCDQFFFGREASMPTGSLPFCVNNGVCKSTWVRQADYPCDCPDGYAGPHCEFAANSVPATCRLGCRNGGTCKIGSPSWQHYYRTTGGGGWTNPLDLEHCKCPDGYTGLLCEIKGTPCGDNYCHHGGTCRRIQQSNNSTQFSCDCTRAVNSNGDVAYAGTFCEQEATTFCSANQDQNGNHFCVNGGTCQSESYLGCTCLDGYTGPLCETVDSGQEPETCSLTCENHGICRKGAKDVSLLTNVQVTEEMKASFNEDFEHCVCPSGYVGLRCEIQLDQCPGGAHVCLHGGECATVPNGTHVSYGCDCTFAESNTSRFAGHYCEMESTQFCTTDHAKTSIGIGFNAYCTNGGKCRGFVEQGQKHPGCSCPREFEGENCQYASNKTGQTVAAVLGSLAVAASIVVVILFLRRRRAKSKSYLYSAHTLPPTLDIIRSLGHDREAEYTDGTMVTVDKPNSAAAAYNYGMSDDSMVIRKSYWPSPVYDASRAIQVYKDVDDDEIRFSRKTYWPNDSHNDAANPIHVFDDISIHSDVEDSLNMTSCDDDDDSNDLSSEDPGSHYKHRSRIV